VNAVKKPVNAVDELSLVEFRPRGQDRWAPVGARYYTTRDAAERDVADKRDTWGPDFALYDWRVSTFTRVDVR